METPLARRDSWPCAASPNMALLGMGIGVAAVWMMSGGVRLFFSSGWSLRAITGRHKGCLGAPLILGHSHSLLSGRRSSCMRGVCPLSFRRTGTKSHLGSREPSSNMAGK